MQTKFGVTVVNPLGSSGQTWPVISQREIFFYSFFTLVNVSSCFYFLDNNQFKAGNAKRTYLFLFKEPNQLT